MASPNCILGIEYLKALKRLESKITPIIIDRAGSSYNSEALQGSFSSATSIRRHISESGNVLDRKLREMLPDTTYNIMLREFQSGRGPVFPEGFETLILAAARRLSTGQLADLPYVSEGLENRIKDASSKAGALEELTGLISTKRYPRTRIQRILFHMLTGLTQKLFNKFNESGGPQYIRVLGFNPAGRDLLAKMSTTCTLPIITKTADHINSPNVLVNEMLSLEAASTDIYVLGYKDPQCRKGGREFTQNPIILK
jgi:predicted nucleotidyltransferase